MAHSLRYYKFETETEALAFAKQQREYNDPSADTYVLGPHFRNENEIFFNMPVANTGKTWWQVTVEIYN
jgi:hypothetical protein